VVGIRKGGHLAAGRTLPHQFHAVQFARRRTCICLLQVITQWMHRKKQHHSLQQHDLRCHREPSLSISRSLAPIAQIKSGTVAASAAVD